MDRSSVMLVILIAVIVSVTCESEDKSAPVPITGKDLVEMGRKFNMPLLRLIGKTLMDLDCGNRGCSHWTEWSTCELFIGKFGVKKRTRECGETGDDKLDTGLRNETDTLICFNNCSSDYERTKEGFCLKYYNTTKLPKADADKSCRNAGGHLLNINSEKKWAAFLSFMDKRKQELVYIDGDRKDNTSPWTFTYETDISGYDNWADNDPDNGSNELCRTAAFYGNAGLYDSACTNDRPYVCENV